MASAVECPSCGGRESRVTDSRPSERPIPNFKRSRRCTCGYSYLTREFLDDVRFSQFIDARGISERDRSVIRSTVAAMKEQP